MDCKCDAHIGAHAHVVKRGVFESKGVICSGFWVLRFPSLIFLSLGWGGLVVLLFFSSPKEKA